MRRQGMQHKEEVTTCVVERETRLELATPTLGKVVLYQLSYSRIEVRMQTYTPTST